MDFSKAQVWLALALSVLAPLAGCAVPSTDTDEVTRTIHRDGGTTVASPSQREADLSRQVLDLVNQVRADNGVPALEWDDAMAAVAWRHSSDMDERNFFDHTNPDGETPFDRLDEAGIAFSAAGENIALGYATPEEAMAGWMSSPGHRGNILSRSFTRLGVGVHEGEGGPWWTQLFRSP